MNVFANSLGHPGNHSFAAMLEMRIAATPVVVEFLSLSQFSHDAALVSYVQKFPGNLWPEQQPESHNLLYVLWSPLHDRVYAGRTVNFERRHTDHCHRIHSPTAEGQIPAYHLLRESTRDQIFAVASFFMLPVVAVVGDVSQAVDAERVFLGNFFSS